MEWIRLGEAYLTLVRGRSRAQTRETALPYRGTDTRNALGVTPVARLKAAPNALTVA